MENIYDGNIMLNHTNISNYINPVLSNNNKSTNNYSTAKKENGKNSQNHQNLLHQQFINNQQQQPSHFTKLLNSNSSNLTNTIPSNSNHTNSNFFISPTLSVKSNRRLSHDNSFIQRIKFRLTKKLKNNCSWKFVAIFFLIISILSLIIFTMTYSGNL